VNYNHPFFQLAIVFILILMTACGNGSSLVLIDEGKSDYVILLGENASAKEEYAATELQKYVEKISNVKLPIVGDGDVRADKHHILVANATLDKHQIAIIVEGDNLMINGGSDESTLYAVYEFLDQYMGCKWYSPTAEFIPEMRTIRIDKDLAFTYTPEIRTRTVHSRLFYENPDFAAKHRVTTEAFPYYVPTAKVHTFHRFMPEEKFYDEHPDYFALRGDKRLPTQLCLTNPDVLRIVKDSVASYFRQFPESTVISVSPNDNQQYCQDALCKRIDSLEGGPTGTLIRFVNEIAVDFPDKNISTLAYQYTRKPSKTPPAKNVMITLCSIECDRSATIEEKCTDFADDLRGWNEISENIRIWDYTTQFTNFLGPFPNIHTLQPNIKFFKDNSAKWVFEQHSHNPSELFELRSYVMAKLLWNPEQDEDAVIKEFTDGYYGKGGVYVKAYIDRIHEEIKNDDEFFLFLYGDPSQAFASYLHPDLLQKYDSLFDEAKKAVDGDAELIQRIERARLGIDYAILEACRKNISIQYNLIAVSENGQKTINPFVVDRLEKFSKTCSLSNIVLMNEMGFKVADYELNYRKALEVALKPNKALGKKVTLLTSPKKYANEDPQALTDGALGGNGFYANWLGFEGNDLEAIIDLGEEMEISSISVAFLQVTNHIVFFPVNVNYSYSLDNQTFKKLGTVENDMPLTKTSRVNDIKYFDLKFDKTRVRYIKIQGRSMKTPPYWHHAAGLPSWIFADEVLIN